MPENPEDFEAFDAKGSRVWIERALLAEPGTIEFLIPHVGNFTIKVSRADRA